jgi:glutathione S-transferase
MFPWTMSDFSLMDAIECGIRARLAKAPYPSRDEYTIADIARFPWTRNHDLQGVKWGDHVASPLHGSDGVPRPQIAKSIIDPFE